MPTKANLELLLGDRILRQSASYDGLRVYRAIPELALLYDDNPQPDENDFKAWFPRMAREIFLKDSLTEGPEHSYDDVIIDPRRRLILHSGLRPYDSSDDASLFTVTGAIQHLQEEHNYEVICFTPESVRKGVRANGDSE